MMSVDWAVYEYFRERTGHPVVEWVMAQASWIGSYKGYALLVPLAVCLLWWFGLKRRVPYFLGLLLGAELLEVGLKSAFGRVRPPGPYEVVGPGFPSGHALVSTVFFGAMALLLVQGMARRGWRVLVWSVALLCVTLISLSRVYLLAHWASDVIGGLIIGVFWLFLCTMTVEGRARHG